MAKQKKDGGSQKWEAELTLLEEMLGSVPMSKEVYTNYIEAKAQEYKGETPPETADEIETVIDNLDARGHTGFHRLEGAPIVYDYVIRGFFKAACGALRRVPGTASEGLTAYKTKIDTLVFVAPRRIRLLLPEGAAMGVNERPLRADTAQGPRVALARSDTVPAGTRLCFTVETLSSSVIGEEHVREWLDYGRRIGLGQWRSGGWGTFEFELK